MAIHFTPEERQLGQENFARAADGMTRRRFLKGVAAAAGATAVVTPAMYFGYQALNGKPVKTALIGAGDEGGVLVGQHNPEFIEFIAVSDLRPFNLDIRSDGKHSGRIFDGDPKNMKFRKGFRKVYGSKANNIKPYRNYEQMLKENPEIEAVVIATPLVSHAPIAIRCMEIGKERGKPIHVMSEKLMARTVGDCKSMIKKAKETGSILCVGHQRHYSLLYANANDIVESGILGDIRHIRALWHRNNSWPWHENPKDPKIADIPNSRPQIRDSWCQPIYDIDYQELKDKLGSYQGGPTYKSIEELVRWRLYDRTGGGLMAELGSHQLDACSIFLGKVHPLAVQGIGGKFFYGPGKNDRESDDSIFVTFEFPGRKHPLGAEKGNDKDDIVVVTYTSVNTNGFEPYGETIVGSRGTLITDKEQHVMLFPENDSTQKKGPARGTTVSVSTSAAGKPVLDSGGTGYSAPAPPRDLPPRPPAVPPPR